jgi:hypothetical protein
MDAILVMVIIPVTDVILETDIILVMVIILETTGIARRPQDRCLCPAIREAILAEAGVVAITADITDPIANTSETERA